jgi:hypothetical protein
VVEERVHGPWRLSPRYSGVGLSLHGREHDFDHPRRHTECDRQAFTPSVLGDLERLGVQSGPSPSIRPRRHPLQHPPSATE